MKNKKSPAKLSFDDIRVGMKRSFRRTISKGDVAAFARLTGDMNPLHVDEDFALGTTFKGTIAHGMLAASLFSTLIGMHCPGKNALILSQDIKYLKPVRPDTKVTVSGKVTAKIDAVKIICVKTAICGKGGEVLVDGETKVKVMG